MTYNGSVPKLSLVKLQAQKTNEATAKGHRNLHPKTKEEINTYVNQYTKRTAPLNPEDFPQKARKGKGVRASIPNVQHLLDQYGIEVKFNEVKKRIDISIPGVALSSANQDNVSMAHILSLASINRMSTTHVPEFVLAVADFQSHNPVKTWISSKEWDGQSRIASILATVTAQPEFPDELKHILIYKWLLSAVAAIYKPGYFKTRGVLTFQGDQGIGKTSWLLSLVPPKALCDAVVKIDHCIDVSNKDSILLAISHWMCELGELESSLKKDMHKLKGFLTSNMDKVRRPYARTESEYPRQTVFFATVNAADFLVDTTGNSRWFTIPVQKVNFEHGIDMQQVFAELLTHVEKGAQWWLDKEEEAWLAEHNAKHMSASYIRDLLLEKVDVQKSGAAVKKLRLTVTETLQALGIDHPAQAQVRECGALLRQYFGQPKTVHGSNKWELPWYLGDAEKRQSEARESAGLTTPPPDAHG